MTPIDSFHQYFFCRLIRRVRFDSISIELAGNNPDYNTERFNYRIKNENHKK